MRSRFGMIGLFEDFPKTDYSWEDPFKLYSRRVSENLGDAQRMCQTLKPSRLWQCCDHF